VLPQSLPLYYVSAHRSDLALPSLSADEHRDPDDTAAFAPASAFAFRLARRPEPLFFLSSLPRALPYYRVFHALCLWVRLLLYRDSHCQI
jgi:hypothetical protein